MRKQQKSDTALLLQFLKKKDDTLVNHLRVMNETLVRVSRGIDSLNSNMSNLTEFIKQGSVLDRTEPQLKRLDTMESFKIDEQPTKKKHKDDKKPFEFPPCISVVPFEEKNLIVSFSSFIDSQTPSNLQSLKLSLSNWSAVLYNKIAQQTFSGYFSRYFSHDQAKAYFTKNIAINFALMTVHISNYEPDLWLKEGDAIIEHFENESSKILQYLSLKYPQQQRIYISNEIREAIPVIDDSKDPDLDYLFKAEIKFQDNVKQSYFQWDALKHSYHKVIKKLINEIIRLSEKHVVQWRKLTKQLFTIDGKQLYNQVGMKFKENTPKYSHQEIQQEGVKIKAPEVLRIIVKWTQQLEKKLRGLANGSLFQCKFKTKSGNNISLQRHFKQYIRQHSESIITPLTLAQNQLRTHIHGMLSLLPQFLSKYESYFPYLDTNDVKSGLLSYILTQTASNISVDYLTKLINLLKSIEAQFCSKIPEFVTFTISDLLRCKCVGSLADIKKVYERLCDQNGPFEVYRVKNRIDTSNKDFLVNVKMKGTPMLCEIQLKVFEKSGDEKQGFVSHFSHLLYELSRASYGPIAEAVKINSYLTDFADFFKNAISKMQNKAAKLNGANIEIVSFGEGSLKLKDDKYQHKYQKKCSLSYLCCNCYTFRLAHSGHLGSYQRLIMDSSHFHRANRMVCGDCVLNSLNQQHKSQYLLGNGLAEFFVQKSGFVDGDDYPLFICAVQKNCPEKTINILQRVEGNRKSSKKKSSNSDLKLQKHSNSKSSGDSDSKVNKKNSHAYVPIFSKLEKQRKGKLKSFSCEDLENNYFIFQLKPTAINIFVEKKRLIKEMKRIKEIPPKNNDQQQQDKEQKQQEQKNVPEKIKKTSSSTQTPTISLLNIISPETYPTSFFPVLPQDLPQMPLAVPKTIPSQYLTDCQSLSVTILYDPNSPHLLLINDCCTTQQLLAITKRKNFNEVQAETLKVAQEWGLEKEGVDNESLNIFMNCSLVVNSIDLSQNSLTELPALKAQQLKYLNLSKNWLTTFELNDEDFPMLQILKLGENRIEKIIKLDKKNLKELFLNSNQIIELNQQQWIVPKLLNIDLKFNQIVQINLTNLQNCQFITLDGNPLKKITFPKSMPNLKGIKLSNNQMSRLNLLETAFPELSDFDASRSSKLETIEFSNTSTNISALNLNGSVNLKTILMSNKVSRLRKLILNNTEIESIEHSSPHPNPPPTTCRTINLSSYNLTTLIQLNLSYCKIEDIVLPALNSILKLDLSHNKLTKINLPLRMPQLSQLILSSNYIGELNFSKITLSQISIIQCTDNWLEKIVWNKNMTKLQKLEFSRNYLKEIDFTGLSLQNSTTINFDVNLIQNVFPPEKIPIYPRCKADFSYNFISRQTLERIFPPSSCNLKAGFQSVTETALSLLRSLSYEDFDAVFLEASELAKRQISADLFREHYQKLLNQYRPRCLIPASDARAILKAMIKLGKIPNSVPKKDLDLVIENRLVCDKGHKLLPFTKMENNQPYRCNVCRKSSNSVDKSADFRCQECDYDLCQSCAGIQ